MDHLWRSHSVLPATDWLLCSLTPLLSQLIALPMRGLLQVQDPLVSCTSLLWGARSHSASCFFFLSFILPGYAEIFVVLSAAQSPLLVFSMYSENCSNCRCILDVFVGRGELHVLLLCHLDSSPWSTILNFMFPAFLFWGFIFHF